MNVTLRDIKEAALEEWYDLKIIIKFVAANLILMPKFCYLFVLLIISIMSMENRLITIYCKEIEDLYNFQRETQEKIFKQNQ